MSNKTIAIINFNQYDGKYNTKSYMYFETKLRAERYLKGNGYEPDVTLKIKRDALSALKSAHKKFEGVELNFRSLIKAIRIRQMGFTNWRQMVAEQVMGVK